MLINKKTIRKILLLNNEEETVNYELVYKQGDWKKKPSWFSKGEKYEQDLYCIWDPEYSDEFNERFLYTLEGLSTKSEFIFKNNKLYRKPALKFYFDQIDYEIKYFDSMELRDKFIQDSKLKGFIEI